MKKSSLNAILVIMIVISAMHFFSPAVAQPTYSPGVIAGNSVTYGSISVTWSSNGANATPPTFIQQLNQTKSLQLKITTVSAKTVMANLTYTYKNGSTTVNPGTANVQDGSGDLSTLIIAGGLSAGYPIYQTPAYPSPTIRETVTKQYAGALRSVNVVSENYTSPYQINQYSFNWDAQTGLLLEYSVSSSYLPFETYTIHIKATTTNLWSPSSNPDFSFDAIPQSPDPVHQGDSASFTLLLNSTNSFAGIIHLRPILLNSTLAKPTLSLTRTDVSLSAGHSNSSVLKFSTNASTPLGLYILTVNGTSSTRSRTISLAVTVSPPDFDLSTRPANLTIPVGGVKSSVVTVRGLGSFSGAISLTLLIQSNLNVTLQPTTVTLSPAVKSANSTLTVQVSLGTVPGPYYGVQVTGTSGLISHSIFLPVNVTGPDFRMSASPFTVTLKQGATAQSTIKLTSILGFQGTVFLSAFSYGVNAVIDKTQVFLNSTISPTVTLTITAPVSAQPGGYYTYVQGNSGILIHSASVNVNVIGPDFSLTANPSFFTIQEGANANSTITLTSILGFQGKVRLAVSNYVSGPTAVINPANVTLTANATATAKLTISTSNAVPGYYYFQIIAQSGNLTRYSSVNMQILGPDFTISSSLISPTLRQGGSVSSTISLGRLENFNGTITLSTLVNGFGLTASISPNSVTLSSNVTSATATLTITAAQNAPTGSYYIQVVGTSGRLSHTAYLYLNVVGPDLRVTTSPSSFILQEGMTASSTVTLTSILGFHGTVTLAAVDYDPNGPTASLNATTLAVAPNGTATAKLTIATSNALPGFYYIQVTARSGNLTSYGSVYVQVIGPDFNMLISSFNSNIRQGTTVTPTLNLSRLNNFNGTVSLLSWVGGPYPGGLTTSLNPASVTLSSTATSATATLTITASQTATPGSYTIQVTGSSGRLNHTAYLFVNVVAPDFQMTISPSSLVLRQGVNGSSTITLTSILGFHGNVTLSAVDYDPNGPTVSLNATSLNLAANSTATSKLNILTSTAVPGYYYLQVEARSGNLTRFGTVIVQIIGPNFNMSISPFNNNIGQGSSVTATLTFDRVENFNGTISISSLVNGPFPGGLTAAVSPQTVTLSSTNTSATARLTLTASQTATIGYYFITITATSGKLTHYIYLPVYVIVAPSFEIAATSPADFNSGATGTSYFTINPLNGFTGNVTIATTISPGTGLNSGCPRNITVNRNATAVTGICYPTSTTPGTYTIKITATSGGIVRNTTFTSNVGGFRISASTPTDFNSGATGQIPIVISSIDNFNGTVTLTGASTTGLTVTCPTTPVTISSKMNGSPQCSLSSTTPGTYEVTIVANGSPGTYSQSTSVVVHVGAFTISAGSGSVNIGAPGASITVSLTSTYNFAGSVILDAAVIPSNGLNVVCPTSAIPLTANTTSVASCTLGSTSPDTYQISITGKGTPGTASHDATSIVHVGDFAISATPTNINSGGDGSISVSLTGINNFAGTVSLSSTSSPSGLTITCPSASITGNSPVTTSCSVTSITPGTYSVTITGTGLPGISLHSVSTVVHVGDFTISIGSPVNFDLGSPNSKISVSLTSTLNFAGPVVLTADANPATGLNLTCPAVTLTANYSSSTYCTLNADKTGTFLVTIKGASLPGTRSHSSSGIVQVADFIITASAPSPSTINAGGSGKSSITIAPINGFSGTVTLAVSPPSGIACSFDHITIQSPGTSNLSCTSNTPGDYAVAVTALGASTFHQTSLTFHVGAGPTQVSSSPTMFGLQLPQFYTLLGGVIVAITVVGVTAVLRRKK
jgi:uncharacterized membrane protein